MKLIQALINLFRHADESAASALSDPVSDGKLAIQDAQKEVNEFLSQIHELMTSTSVMDSKLRDARAEVEKYDTIARRAAAAGNRDDVTAAVAEKQRAMKTFETLAANVEANRLLERKLRQQLADARQKIAEAEMNRARLSANISGNKLRGNLAKASVEFAGKSKGLAALDQLDEASRRESAKADAWEMLSADSPEAKAKSLEDKYGGAGAAVDAEVEALMSGGGKPPERLGGGTAPQRIELIQETPDEQRRQ